MDKQKQIEEMARVIIDETDECDRMHGFVVCDYCNRKDEDGWCLLGYYIAEELYNAGFRKIPEGAVVLTKEEYVNRLTKYYGVTEIKDMVRKETAEKFAERLVEMADLNRESLGSRVVYICDIENVCKEITEGRL